MKKLLIIPTLLLGLFAMTLSCGTSQGAQASKRDYADFNNLADVLRLQSGVLVSGSGSGTRVFIRGLSSINGGEEPLYIINDVPVGNQYYRANDAVNPADIESVRVLKDQAKTVRYGAQGANGVIIIKTKKATDRNQG